MTLTIFIVKIGKDGSINFCFRTKNNLLNCVGKRILLEKKNELKEDLVVKKKLF